MTKGFLQVPNAESWFRQSGVVSPPRKHWGHDGCRLAKPCRDTPAGRQPLGDSSSLSSQYDIPEI